MTVRDDLREFIRSALLVDVDDEESFLASGTIDSLGIVQLVGFVEAELDVPVTGEDLVPANFDSVAKLDAFVHRKRES